VSAGAGEDRDATRRTGRTPQASPDSRDAAPGEATRRTARTQEAGMPASAPPKLPWRGMRRGAASVLLIILGWGGYAAASSYLLWRHGRALDRDVRTDQAARLIAIVDPAQLRDDARALLAAVLDFERSLPVPIAHRPNAEADDVRTRLTIRENLDPTTNAVHAADTAERDELAGVRAHCVIAERARSGRGGGALVLLQQVGHALGLLRALAHPVIHAGLVDAEALLAARRDRIEEADSFDVTPVARVAPVRDDDVIERPLDGAAARETNDDHSLSKPCRNPVEPRRPSRPRAEKAAFY